MLPELKERSKKWDEEYKKKRQELVTKSSAKR